MMKLGGRLLALALCIGVLPMKVAPAAEKKAALKGKKVLMVIAARDFQDTELSVTRQKIEEAGASVTVASTKVGTISGMLGGTASAEVLLKDVTAAPYAAVVFIGGSGTKALFDDADAHRLARNGVAEKKVVGAICIAPCILAKAGVLKDRRATVWAGKEFVDILKANGARVRKQSVVGDGKIVTGNGPKAAEKFGARIVRVLSAKTAAGGSIERW